VLVHRLGPLFVLSILPVCAHVWRETVQPGCVECASMRARSEAERNTFRDRIHAYERTELWRDRSRRFRASRRVQQCEACRRPGIEDVHHASYDRAFTGNEPDADLRGLCHRCHMAIHQLTSSHGGSMSLWDATSFVLDHTPRWDVVPPQRQQLVYPWRYVPPPPRRSTYVPPDPLPARWVPTKPKAWWRRKLVPLLFLAAFLVFGVVSVVAQLHR